MTIFSNENQMNYQQILIMTPMSIRNRYENFIKK